MDQVWSVSKLSPAFFALSQTLVPSTREKGRGVLWTVLSAQLCGSSYLRTQARAFNTSFLGVHCVPNPVLGDGNTAVKERQLLLPELPTLLHAHRSVSTQGPLQTGVSTHLSWCLGPSYLGQSLSQIAVPKAPGLSLTTQDSRPQAVVGSVLPAALPSPSRPEPRIRAGGSLVQTVRLVLI